MNFKTAALLACIMLAPRSWAMQQTQVKTAPASIATTIAQNPRYLFYASAGCFAGTVMMKKYLQLQLRKIDQRLLDEDVAEYITGANKKKEKEFEQKHTPAVCLFLALAATTGITFAAGCILKAKNKFSPAIAK